MMAKKLALLFLAATLTTSTTAIAATEHARLGSGPDPGKPGFDVRLPASTAARGGFVLREPSAAQRAAIYMLAATHPDLVWRWDGISGSPKWLAAAPGSTLSGPLDPDPERAARAFLLAHADLYGLSPAEVRSLQVTSTVPAPDGGYHVYLTQSAAGLEVFGGRVNVNVTPEGAIRSIGARLYGGIRIEPLAGLGPEDAVATAIRDVYPDRPIPSEIVHTRRDGDLRTVFDGAGFGFPPEARLIVFPEADGARLAWEVRVAEATLFTSYRILVDARDGTMLYRTNTTAYAEARALDSDHPEPQAEEFAPAQHVLRTIPSSTPESPNGWISGGGTTLEGNNVTSHLGYWSEPGLSEPSAIYDDRYNTPSSALVNAWWWVNEAHDRFYALGFDEEAGNFQQSNLGNPGVAGDPIGVVVTTAGLRDGPYFGPFNVDGGVSYIHLPWVDCRFCGDHDGYPENGGERSGAFDRDLVFHEFTHGVTIRVLGGPGDDSCFGGTQSWAMGEGWSDLFPASFHDDPTVFEHVIEGSGWSRSLRHDLTYDHLCHVADPSYPGTILESRCNLYGDGLIWTGTLWDLRESMQALDPTDGVDAFDRIVLEGIAHTVCHPTMIDARDGILQADTALYGSAHHQVIWNVFAGRGMGENASSTGESDTSPVTDYTVPAAHACSSPPVPTGPSASAEGDNAIRLDYDASGAAAVEVWRDDLDNPFDRPAWIASTDDLATFLDETVHGGKNYRYHLVALGGGGVACRSAESGTADATATGGCGASPIFDPGLTVTDGDPDCALRLTWNAAAEGCPGSGLPIVYNVYRAPAPGFEPSDRLLVGRTTSTTLDDVPPETADDGFHLQTGETSYYLVLAQHGTLADPPDHRDRGSSQLLRWVPGLPTLGRTTVHSWDFESGPSGWTTDNSKDPAGGWVLVDPSPTHYAGGLLAPDEAAGGAGLAWVTGDAGGPSSITDNDCDRPAYLSSPSWDGTSGATILSLDYWAHLPGNFWGGLDLRIENGTDTVVVRVAGLMTVQPFETAGRYGWQRAELDLAKLIAPSDSMSVTFVSSPTGWFTEYGVDNVRVERATACARSALKIDAVTVDDSPPGWGNANGVLEPGETARLVVELANQGSVTAFSPVGTVSTSAPGVLVHEDAADFPDIPPSGSGVSTGDGFTVTLMDDARCEETVVFEFEFTDAAGTTTHGVSSAELGYTVTESVFQDDFETDTGWLAGGGIGQWERGDPVGTMDGSNQANPENDSPNDAGTMCYVTDNGPVGGDPNANDVDGGPRVLRSPSLDLRGYKRAHLTFDLWYYDSSPTDPWQDYCDYGAIVDDGVFRDDQSVTSEPELDATNGWSTRTVDLSRFVPMASDVRLRFQVRDRLALEWQGGANHVVEMGVDNIRVTGDAQVCDALGVVGPPNGVGDTVRADKGIGTVTVLWSSSPTDPTHDGAAYYQVYASGAPDSGFSVAETATTTSITSPLDDTTEFFKVVAVNPAGTSGDEPAP